MEKPGRPAAPPRPLPEITHLPIQKRRNPNSRMRVGGSRPASTLDIMLRFHEHMCMELTVAQIAGQHGRTPRFVQQAVRSGDLSALRLMGRLAVMDDLAATAWARSLARGRRWSVDVRDVALDLLSTGRTDRLSSSERSRLRSRLRGMSAAGDGACGGRSGRDGRVTACPVCRTCPRVGPSAVDQTALGSWPGRVGSRPHRQGTLVCWSRSTM